MRRFESNAMSYELDYVQKSCPCPCGNGKIVYGWGTNDWNQVREGMKEIWCPECSRKYKFAQDGLLPIDYPEYQGDPELKKEIDKLSFITANYCGFRGFEFWDKEIYRRRVFDYLSDEERQADKISGQHYYYLSLALGYAKSLANEYTLENLVTARAQLLSVRFSTELSGVASRLAEKHKIHFKTIKPKNVLVPVEMAVRNYNAYKLADEEDRRFVEEMTERLEKLKAEYFKEYPQYEAERKKHIVHYSLIDHEE